MSQTKQAWREAQSSLAARIREVLDANPVTVNLLAVRIGGDFDETRTALSKLGKAVAAGWCTLPGVAISQGPAFQSYGRTMHKRLWSKSPDYDSTAPAIVFAEEHIAKPDRYVALEARVAHLEKILLGVSLHPGTEDAIG